MKLSFSEPIFTDLPIPFKLAKLRAGIAAFILSKPRLNSFPAYAVSLAYLDYRWRFAVAFQVLPG
jgi:hypothetical protein